MILCITHKPLSLGRRKWQLQQQLKVIKMKELAIVIILLCVMGLAGYFEQVPEGSVIAKTYQTYDNL